MTRNQAGGQQGNEAGKQSRGMQGVGEGLVGEWVDKGREWVVENGRRAGGEGKDMGGIGWGMEAIGV